jgi:hypothetical protein
MLISKSKEENLQYDEEWRIWSHAGCFFFEVRNLVRIQAKTGTRPCVCILYLPPPVRPHANGGYNIQSCLLDGSSAWNIGHHYYHPYVHHGSNRINSQYTTTGSGVRRLINYYYYYSGRSLFETSLFTLIACRSLSILLVKWANAVIPFIRLMVASERNLWRFRTRNNNLFENRFLRYPRSTLLRNSPLRTLRLCIQTCSWARKWASKLLSAWRFSSACICWINSYQYINMKITWDS